MFGLFESKIRPIGLDISYDAIRMIQLGSGNDNPCVIAAEKYVIDYDIRNDVKQRDDFIVQAIKEMITKGGFYGRNVVSCLPNDRLAFRRAQISLRSEDGLEALTGRRERPALPDARTRNHPHADAQCCDYRPC